MCSRPSFPLLFKSPRKTGCPLSLKTDHHDISNFVAFSIGFVYEFPYHFFSEAGLGNDLCPGAIFWRIVRNNKRIRNTQLFVSFFSLCNVIVHGHEDDSSWNGSGSHNISVIMFWISARIPNVVKFFHPNSIGSPSI